MKRLIFCALGFLLLVTAYSAFCADLVGIVSDPQGNPIAGVEIGVRDGTGKVVGKAITDATGHYTSMDGSPVARRVRILVWR